MILYLSSLNLLYIEFNQLYIQGHVKYFSNGWNKIDLFGSLIFGFGVILKFSYEVVLESSGVNETTNMLFSWARYSDLLKIFF